ncbi:hypothetical protein [Flagellimonas pacifica]|uniref:Uncharacterized protein n=1 Tax=Flagellimonas pacifica TaxID=1247520 RepID=A0A285MTB9_9FLAO|nr:hypothetical protein [Allomuricauda parva]SNZ00424.1 hypothetical protein SAMN06265377_2248 [Allomuricauda parva]
MSCWKDRRKGLNALAVFTENNQVFLKREKNDLINPTNAQWYPIEFKWIPVLEDFNSV